MKNTFLLLFLSGLIASSPTVKAQEHQMDLAEAIGIAQHQSFDYKVAKNRYQSSIWNFQNYKLSAYPTLNLDGVIPDYGRTISRITLPNGDDTFVNQNQAYSSLNLGLSQNINATGGILTLGSSLNRIDVFGNNRTVNYSSVPVSISYLQNTIGYNEFKWLKKTEPLRFQVADKEALTNMEQIASETVNVFFNLLTAEAKKKLSVQNAANADTLYRISKDRFKLGTVSQSELLQLRLNVLNAQKQLTLDSVDLVLAGQQFSRYLAMPADAILHPIVPEQIRFFKVTFEDALDLAKNNSKEVLLFRLNRLESQKNLAKVKAESKLKFNIQANFGLSNVAPSIPGLFSQLQNQQNIAVGFSVPLLDWGNAKTRRLRAEADLALVESQVQQGQMQLEQEIAFQVSRWNLQQQQLGIAVETRDISAKNYELEKQRYLSGNIGINDLNIAQNNRDNSINAYYQAIRVYWEIYYILRRLTLYDFKQREKLQFRID